MQNSKKMPGFRLKSWGLLYCGILFLSGCDKGNNYPMVTTFAGNGAMGSANGKGNTASFANMIGVAADEKGNLFVADSHNNLIRKISAEGIVTTVAGNGSEGSVDGKADTASFFNPAGIAVDKKGNVYVADTHNSLIRKISPDGFVSTFAGKRIYKSIPGVDSTVRFDNPSGIAVDKEGNVYVADWANDMIRKISPEGKVTNIAGNNDRGSKDGRGSSASFYLPGGIAVDSAGTIYVADTYNNMIRKISPEGVVTTLAGNGHPGSANGKGPAATFLHPSGITVDSEGSLFVADAGNNKIRRVGPDGMVTNLAGSGKRGSINGRDSTVSFNKPMGITTDGSGNIYVADYQNNMIRKISF
jgi:sugar lactone lactonase YvrE